MEQQPKNSGPETRPDYEVLQGLQEHTAIKKEIEDLQSQEILETTIETLKKEIDFLKRRKDELHNSIMKYEADDTMGLKVDYDNTSKELDAKKIRLQNLSQDMDMLNATIEGIEEIITKRAQEN